jgi:hypothetical protein
MSRSSPLQRCAGFRRIYQDIRKSTLVSSRKPHHLCLLDGVSRRLLHRSHNEISHRSPFNLSGSFQERMEVRTDPGFKACRRRWHK